MKEQNFTGLVREIKERDGWFQMQGKIYVKPGRRDELGHPPKAPITILHTPDKGVLVERIAIGRVKSLLLPRERSRIQHDALAVFVTDETGKDTKFCNEEFQFIIGLHGYNVVAGGDRIRLATLYKDIESRLQLNIDLNPPSEISTGKQGNPVVSKSQ